MKHSQRNWIPLFSALALLLGGLHPAFGQGRDPRQPGAEVRGLFKSATANSITLTSGTTREAAPTEKTYPLAKDVEVAVGSAFRTDALHEIKIADLPAGVMVSLIMTADQKAVDSILAEEPAVRGLLKSIDAKKGLLTVAATFGREPGEDATTYSLTKDAEIAIDDGRGRRYSIREGTLDDLGAGSWVTLRLTLDKKNVVAIQAEGPVVMGTLKELDAEKGKLTLTLRPARGDDAGEERHLIVAKEAAVLVDDGKGRRLSLKTAKLADIAVGSTITGKLSADQTMVMSLRAQGPMLIGLLKGVDAGKGIIILGIPKNREEFDEKTLTLAKDAHITLDGAVVPLTDLKVGENGPFIQVRMTLDQKSAQSVMARQPGSR